MMDIRTLEAVLRNDFVSFVQKAFRDFDPGTELRLENYIRLICATLVKVEAGYMRRLVVTLPPRHLKSFLISVALPAWILGRDPTRKIMVISHDIVLAKELSKACRNIMKQQWFRKTFPNTRLARDSDTILQFKTDQGGGRFAASMDTGVTGHGADMIIIDDPLAAHNAYSEAEREKANTVFDTMIASRLNDRTRGAIIVVAQRLHEKDLVGHVLPKAATTTFACHSLQTRRSLTRSALRPGPGHRERC